MKKCLHLLLLFASLVGCSTGAESRRASPQGVGGSPGGIVSGGTGGSSPISGGVSPPGGEVAVPRCNANCQDFPPDPIFEPGAPPTAPGLFGQPDRFASGSLCLLEPQISTASSAGALLPANWVR